MKTLQFDGEEVNLPTILASPELVGFYIVSIRFSRWTDPDGVDKGGRIDIDVEEIAAPIIYKTEVHATDFLVSSRDIKDDPEEASAEALTETNKSKGQPKSLDLISRSTLKVLGKMRDDMAAMQDEIKNLKKRIKDLEKKV